MNIKEIEKKIDQRISDENEVYDSQVAKLETLRNNKLKEIFNKHFNMFKKLNIEALLVSHGVSANGTLYIPDYWNFEELSEMESSLIGDIKRLDQDIFEKYKQDDKKILMELSKINGYRVDYITINMYLYKDSNVFGDPTTKTFLELFYKFVSEHSDFKVEMSKIYINGNNSLSLSFKEK